MTKKNIKKAIAYTAATAAICAVVDLMAAFTVRAWDYDDFKDDHYKMDALKTDEKKLAQVYADHQALQKPIQTLFFGKISNKCPICGE